MTSRLHTKLEEYKRLTGEDVHVVYHPNKTASWQRATFQGEDYNPDTAYNHRTIYSSEIVLEYDDADRKTNYELAIRASKKMTDENAAHSIWTSGNKSTHIHAFFNFSDAENVRYLKRLILKHFGSVKHLGEWYEPDMALASPNHLVRAEYGVHESTGNNKALVDASRYFPQYNSIPVDVWDKYDSNKHDYNNYEDEELVESVANSEAFRWLLDPENVREVGDGRKRGVFILGNILWQQTDKSKEDIINFCKEWYREAGGHDYKDSNIRNALQSNFQRGGYTPGYLYLNDYLSDIGMENLLKEKTNE